MDSIASGSNEYTLSADEPAKFGITDFGALEKVGHTSRFTSFIVEDNADIRITISDQEISVESTGKEFMAKKEMDRIAMSTFEPLLEAAGDDPSAQDSIYNLYRDWELEYYRNNPMLGFLLDIESGLSNFSFINKGLGKKIDLYESFYKDEFTSHSVHSRIKSLLESGMQVCGRTYNDYNIRNTEGNVVKASDYFSGKLTAVVCWATWCPPCRKDAINLIPVYERFRDRGLNIFSIAHEFKSPDDFLAAVKQDNYPWPTFYELDNEFDVFKKHGTSSSGIFLVDESGKIIDVMYSPEELESRLSGLLN